MVWKTRPWTICSFKVRNSRSMTPFVPGSPTKAWLGGMPQNLACLWKCPAMKLLP